MLILSRHRDEEIIITAGDVRIRVAVVDIRGDTCRLGVDAPAEVVVHRAEIQREIDRDAHQRPGS